MSFHSSSKVNNHTCEEDQLSRNAVFLLMGHSWARKQIPHFLGSAKAPQRFHKTLHLIYIPSPDVIVSSNICPDKIAHFFSHFNLEK